MKLSPLQWAAAVIFATGSVLVSAANAIALDGERWRSLVNWSDEPIGSLQLVVHGADTCAPSLRLLEALGKVVDESRIVVPFVPFEARHAKMLRERFKREFSTPTLIVISDDVVVDVIEGAPRTDVDLDRQLRSFLGNHGFTADQPIVDALPSSLPRLPVFRRPKSWPFARFDGADLRNLELPTGNFTGSSFRGADLRGANLRIAIFSHANLTSARLEGADLAEVLWYRTRCPDGSMSEDHEQGCASFAHPVTDEPDHSPTSVSFGALVDAAHEARKASDADGAIRGFESAVEQWNAESGDGRQLARTMNNLAVVLMSNGRLHEAAYWLGRAESVAIAASDKALQRMIRGTYELLLRRSESKRASPAAGLP